MDKIDFKKSFKSLYGPTKRLGIHVVEVPAMRFLMVDGHGDPNNVPAFSEALETLYSMAYALKFASKQQLDRDYVVPPLEGLWWSKDMNSFIVREKDKWDWTMMVMVPEWIGPAMIDRTIEGVRAKKAPVALNMLRVEMFEEGKAVQVLHVGPFDDEGPVLEELHKVFLPHHGLVPTGTHHEIYLSDRRRVAPARMRTILRQAVR